jgi:hypothetical protein
LTGNWAWQELKVLYNIVIELAVVESTILVIPVRSIGESNTILETGISQGAQMDKKYILALGTHFSLECYSETFCLLNLVGGSLEGLWE